MLDVECWMLDGSARPMPDPIVSLVLRAGWIGMLCGVLSGGMEAAFCILALRERIIPGQAHLRDLDPICADLHIPRTTVAASPQLALNNSSGFGGANVCHVFGRMKDEG